MTTTETTIQCDDCGDPIGQDDGPPDGWQLEDGRTVCHSCCLRDFQICGFPGIPLPEVDESCYPPDAEPIWVGVDLAAE